MVNNSEEPILFLRLQIKRLPTMLLNTFHLSEFYFLRFDNFINLRTKENTNIRTRKQFRCPE